MIAIFSPKGNRMKSRNCLVLSQYRDGDEFNDFVGKYYHFPVNAKNYLKQFDSLPIEIFTTSLRKKAKESFSVMVELKINHSKIIGIKTFYFVEIAEFKRFATPVFF